MSANDPTTHKPTKQRWALPLLAALLVLSRSARRSPASWTAAMSGSTGSTARQR